jgi:hypothetical protein
MWKTVQLDRLNRSKPPTMRLKGAPGRVEDRQPQHVNDMYLVLLAGHWQEFCRILHTEAAAFLTSKMPPSAQIAIEAALTQRRWLDRGNPNIENIREDFARFGMDIWGKVLGLDIRNEKRRDRLKQLLVWRNAIVHQDLPPKGGNATTVSGTSRTLDWARTFRDACSQLAVHFDRVAGDQLALLVGSAPW